MTGLQQGLELLVSPGLQLRILRHQIPCSPLSFPEEALVPREVGEPQDRVSAMLLGSEEVSLSPDLEIRPGDFKPIRRAPENLETFSGQVPRLRDQNAGALIRPPAYSPSELVQL